MVIDDHPSPSSVEADTGKHAVNLGYASRTSGYAGA